MSFEKTPAMMEWLQERLGVPFPFKDKYYQVITPLVGGAMENITLTTFDHVFLLDDIWKHDWQYLTDQVNIHEMTHSYFGDSVVIRHFEHAWLKESWANYFQAIWSWENISKEEGDYQIYASNKSFKIETRNYMRPIVEKKYNTSWAMFDRHTYPGGSLRIHQIRRLLGEDNFWSAVTDYLETYARKVVETNDFRRKLEDHSYVNLTKYFDQWIHSCGHPVIKVEKDFNIENMTLKLDFKQTQRNDEKNIPVFDLNPKVLVVDNQGNTYLREVVFEDSDHEQLILQLDNIPVSIEIDPNYDWPLIDWSFDPGTEMLKHTYLNAECVHSRIWAGQTLIKNYGELEFVCSSSNFTGQIHFGVQIEVVETLSTVKSTLARDIILSNLSDLPLNCRVQAQFLQGLQYQHDSIRDFIIDFLKSEDLTYNVRSEALKVLGAQRNDEDIEYLQEQVVKYATTGYYPYVTDGAIQALALTRSYKAFHFLTEKLIYGSLPEYSRAFSIQSITTLALYIGGNYVKSAVEILESLLGEREYHLVLKHAIKGLIKLNSKKSIPIIKSVRPYIANQFQQYLDRDVVRLEKATADNSYLEIQDRVDTMQKKIADLEQSLRKN
eukprot:TRINITY_DN4086_c0_g1_i2.p1 TRINITY_DN4086_c0_g1~~TRINITY_DN4086_c0_g1_i2.p1  ORF type:complete len:608 (-),score=128.28 TRINITY_DN4086_c0_g1_i2:268-2091(-)